MTRSALRCSICNKLVPDNARAFPFCSERCRLNDLANWLGEAYVVPSPVDDDAKLEVRSGHADTGGDDDDRGPLH